MAKLANSDRVGDNEKPAGSRSQTRFRCLPRVRAGERRASQPVLSIFPGGGFAVNRGESAGPFGGGRKGVDR